MNKIFFIIGASGAGKTTAAKELEKIRKDIQFCYFDTIGVPTTEEMIEQYGSGENWQKIKTIEWVNHIKETYLVDKPTLLDAQTRPSFIQSACQENGISDYTVILFDCDDKTRSERLHQRGQEELAHTDMMNWVRYLREECKKYNYPIIDTTNYSIETMRNVLERELERALKV